MSEYISEPNSLGVNVKIELYQRNCGTKTDLKNATGSDTSSFG